MTTAEAADYLGVTRRQAERLAAAGEFRLRRTSSGTYLIESDSVVGRASKDRPRGRPWKAETAWAALFELSGMRVDWLHPSAMSRLRARLETLTAGALATNVATRSQMRTYLTLGDRAAIAKELLPTGISAIPSTELIGGNTVEGYLRSSDLETFARRYYLAASDTGDVVIHIGVFSRLLELNEAPAAVVAADLARHEHPRESNAGIQLLNEVMERWRAGR